MKKYKTILFILTALLLQNIHAHEEPKADVVISLQSGDSCIEIERIRIPKPYDVSALINSELFDALVMLDKKIKTAKEIPLTKVEKSFEEGVYIIEYLEEGKKYSVQNNLWIYESESKKYFRCNILNELRLIKQINEQSEFYHKYYLKKNLSLSDCEDIDFIKWLFAHETGIQINDKNIDIIKKDYSGGIPVSISQIPVYYKITITNEEYRQFKKDLKKKSEWKLIKGKIHFLLITKFNLGCIIKEDELIFGFSGMDIIQP